MHLYNCYCVVPASERTTENQWVKDNVPGCELAEDTFSVPAGDPITHYAFSWRGMTHEQHDLLSQRYPELAASDGLSFDQYLAARSLSRHVTPE